MGVALRRRAGQDDIGSDCDSERLIRPVRPSDHDLEEGCRAMAADADREREALAWIEAEPGDALP